MAQKEIQPSLELNRKVNICKYRGDEVIVTIDLGKISPSDKFFGYELGLSYDNTKLTLDKFLPNGTLTEFFESDKRGMNVITEGNKTTLDVYAVTFSINNSISGEKPLIAFGGKFIGDCNDTAIVNIDWLEFTDEFTPIVSEDSYIKIDGSIPEDNAFVKADIFDLIDTLKYMQPKNYSLKIEKDNSEIINEMLLTFEIENGFEIENIRLNSDLVDIMEIEKSKNKIVYKITNLSFEGIEEILWIDVVYTTKEKFRDANASMELTILDDCSCVSKTISDFYTFNGAYEDPTTVDDNIRYTYYQIDNDIRIISDNEIFTRIQIYNILGQKIKDFENSNSEINIDMTNQTKGIYFLLLSNNITNKIEKLILN